MPDYRVHIFARSGGGNPAKATLSCDDDDEAIRLVEENAQGHLTEMWDGDRLVKRFEARTFAPPPMDDDDGEN